MAWLQTLEFLLRWTATLETSLRSGLKDRLHLHVFMEFNKAVDWTGLRAVTFNGVRPNAQATAGRGAKMRELKNHGHFYVFADKASPGLSEQHWQGVVKYRTSVVFMNPKPHLQVGTLKVATSGYEPWKDYPVKGRWLDSLWSEHKLTHDVYIRYALGPYPVVRRSSDLLGFLARSANGS